MVIVEDPSSIGGDGTLLGEVSLGQDAKGNTQIGALTEGRRILAAGTKYLARVSSFAAGNIINFTFETVEG